jgi:hypothetical protein
MQWIVDHWFEIVTTALLAIIAINTLDRRWNNSTLVEQLNDMIRSFSSLARQDAASRVIAVHPPSGGNSGGNTARGDGGNVDPR